MSQILFWSILNSKLHLYRKWSDLQKQSKRGGKQHLLSNRCINTQINARFFLYTHHLIDHKLIEDLHFKWIVKNAFGYGIVLFSSCAPTDWSVRIVFINRAILRRSKWIHLYLTPSHCSIDEMEFQIHTHTMNLSPLVFMVHIRFWCMNCRFNRITPTPYEIHTYTRIDVADYACVRVWLWARQR